MTFHRKCGVIASFGFSSICVIGMEFKAQRWSVFIIAGKLSDNIVDKALVM